MRDLSNAVQSRGSANVKCRCLTVKTVPTTPTFRTALSAHGARRPRPDNFVVESNGLPAHRRSWHIARGRGHDISNRLAPRFLSVVATPRIHARSPVTSAALLWRSVKSLCRLEFMERSFVWLSSQVTSLLHLWCLRTCSEDLCASGAHRCRSFILRGSCDMKKHCCCG